MKLRDGPPASGFVLLAIVAAAVLLLFAPKGIALVALTALALLMVVLALGGFL